MAFGYFFASHPPFDDVFVTLRTLSSLGRGEIVLHIGKHNILRHAVAIGVPSPEVVLGNRIPLLGVFVEGLVIVGPTLRAFGI